MEVLYNTMKKNVGKKNNKYKSKPSIMERLQEVCYRSREKCFGFVRGNYEEGSKEMTEKKKEWKKSFEVNPSKIKEGQCKIYSAKASGREIVVCKERGKLKIYPATKEE